MAVKTFVSGEILTASDTNTYLNNGGLVWISTTTVGSAVASVTITAFSSTYDHYRIIYSQIVGTAGANMSLKLGPSSPANGYYGALTYMSVTTSSAYAGVNDNNAAGFGYIGSTNQNAKFTGSFDLLNPFLTEGTVISGSPFIKISPAFDIGVYNGGLNNSTSYTQLILAPNTGTLTGGFVSVYGYRKA